MSTVSGRDAWAAGFAWKPAAGRFGTLLLHWNGTAWSPVASPDPGKTDSFLQGVSAAASGGAWAVGSYSRGNTLRTLVLKWSGTAWSQVSSPSADPAGNVLNGVSADSAGDAWAVGYYVSKSVRYALVLQWNGAAWSVR